MKILFGDKEAYIQTFKTGKGTKPVKGQSKISYYYTQIYLKMLCAVQDLISQDHNAASIEVRKRSHRKI